MAASLIALKVVVLAPSFGGVFQSTTPACNRVKAWLNPSLLTAIRQVLEYHAIEFSLISFARAYQWKKKRMGRWEEEVKKLSPPLNQMHCKEATIRVTGKEYEGTLI